ncbi:MAG: hypothetical protein NTY02_17465, partial [Acidobacteria bacterium]|nr:hypothetical protein [Acidobacteriota bacterium]
VVVIVTLGYFWFIQAPLAAYMRSRADAVALADRVKTLQASAARASGAPAGDLEAPLRAFEQQVSREDKVADVTSLFAKAVLDSAPADKLREFSIETGDRVGSTLAESGSGRAPVASRGAESETPDLRLSLFPAPVSYTPVKVTFASTFEAVAGFMWKVRDLPTTVEIRSATLTRGLPLMKLELLAWVYQRGAAAGAAPQP